MTKTLNHLLRKAALPVLALAAATFSTQAAAAASPEAITNPSSLPAFQHQNLALDEAPPRLILAGFKRRSTTSRRSTVGPRGFGSAGRPGILQRDRRFGSSGAARGFGSSITSGLLRRDRTFGGSRVLRGSTLPLVRGSRLSSSTLFGPSPRGFRRGAFDDSAIRALRAEALALDAAARLKELGLTPAQAAAAPAMPPALVRALTLAKIARAEAAAVPETAP